MLGGEKGMVNVLKWVAVNNTDQQVYRTNLTGWGVGVGVIHMRGGELTSGTFTELRIRQTINIYINIRFYNGSLILPLTYTTHMHRR